MSPKRGKHLSCDDFTEKQVTWECGKSTRDILSQFNIKLNGDNSICISIFEAAFKNSMHF